MRSNRSLLFCFGCILILISGCSSGVFVSCPEGAEKTRGAAGGYACKRADGTAHGPFRKLHPDGAVAEIGNFEDGLEQGVFESWFADGSARSRAEYRNGELWSTLTAWHNNGDVAVEQGFEEGVPVGVHRWIDDEGLPSQEIEYIAGLRARESRFGRLGKKIFEARWDGEVPLLEERWNLDGVKLLEARELQGENGSLKRWNDQGEMMSLASYAGGYPIAESVFHGNGAVREKRKYGELGRILSYEVFDRNGAQTRRLNYDPQVAATVWPATTVGSPGIELLFGERLQVASVVHGGPGATAGLRPGDELVSIGEWQLPDGPDQELVYGALQGEVGTAVVLVVRTSTGELKQVEVSREHRDLLDPRRLISQRWSVAGTLVERLSYKGGFLVEERRWFESGNKRKSADYDAAGRLVWQRSWYEIGQLSEEIAPLQGETHLLWQSWDEKGARTGRGTYLWGTSTRVGSLLKDGEFSYWQEGGVPKSTVQWKQGLKEGPYASYHLSGEPREEGSFKSDLREGRWTTYREPEQRDAGIPFSTLESKQMYAAGQKHGSFERYDAQCGWWVEKGSYKEGRKHGEWSSRPGPRYYSCDPSGMASRGSWTSRNRAQVCSKGTYRDGLKYGVWKERRDCWCEAGEASNCEVIVRNYGNEEMLVSEEISNSFD
tara:strand:- start:104 stop:2089 length:1986 start_codon:yes stop_codon:yes gene_type:complete